MARTIDDILSRRVRLLFLDARAAVSVADKVAKELAKELGHNEEWAENQIIKFKKLANGFLLEEYQSI
jgi:glycerol-3-phosphate dehydrogenase